MKEINIQAHCRSEKEDIGIGFGFSFLKKVTILLTKLRNCAILLRHNDELCRN